MGLSIEWLDKYELTLTKYFERYYSQKLMTACGAILRLPQRLTNLTKEQEASRWVWTLRSYDEAMYMAK